MSRLALAVLAAALGACTASFPERPLVRLDPDPVEIELSPPPEARESAAPVPLDDLTVEEAVLLALENDRDLAVQSLAPVVAGTFEAQERALFDPQLFAEAGYFRERASQTARATGERFDVLGESTDEVVGLRQRLPTGTTLELLLAHRLDVSDRTPAQNEARVGLTVTQSLLQGLGPAVNLAALHIAELDVEASVHQLRAFAAAVVAGVEVAYWTLALRTAQVDVFERATAVAEREAALVRDQIEVGLLPEIDLAAAEAELAFRRQALVDARASREDARLRLLRRLSPDPAGRLGAPVRTASPLAVEAEPLRDVDARAELAARERPEIGEARVRVRQGRLQTVATDNGLLPRLDAFAALAKTGFDESFGDAFGRLDGPTYDVRAGLSFDYFIGARAAQAADLAARATVRQSKRALENLERMVRLEVRLSANELERARAQIGASRITREAREAAVAAERARVEVGQRTAIFLVRAERDLVESQIAELRSAVDFRIARVNLYLAEGTLLARRGIVVVEP